MKRDDFTGFSLAIDSIKDPGNLGNIIRLCDWFGVEHLYCSRGSVDFFNPKTIQSSMGSLARVNCHSCDLDIFLKQLFKINHQYQCNTCKKLHNY